MDHVIISSGDIAMNIPWSIQMIWPSYTPMGITSGNPPNIAFKFGGIGLQYAFMIVVVIGFDMG
jgi:hypothetical protein